jgi:hypothetical protein
LRASDIACVAAVFYRCTYSEHNQNMPPVMSRQDSRSRAEQAFALHACGRTWADISRELGYKSRSAACDAVTRLHRATPAASPDVVRRSATETLRLLRSMLFDRVVVAKAAGDDDTLIALHRELTRNLSETAKLHGAYAAQQIDVNVTQTPSELIAEAREKLLAVIDAEVVEPREIER